MAAQEHSKNGHWGRDLTKLKLALQSRLNASTKTRSETTPPNETGKATIITGEDRSLNGSLTRSMAMASPTVSTAGRKDHAPPSMIPAFCHLLPHLWNLCQ